MSTEKKSENTATTIDNKTNNKALFGPLGKYAIAGVIMVSIMISTVILLNKQLGTTAEDIAAIEKAFTESNASELNSNESTVSIDTTSAIESENNQIQDSMEVVKTEVTPVEVEAAVVQTTKVAVADTVTTAEETTSDIKQNTKQAPSTAQVATIEPAKAAEIVKAETVVKNTAQTPLPQLATGNQDQQWQTRIQSHKLEQKQRMSEMFSRIRSLESQHLEQYKIHQDEQIEHLHEQIARQQEQIEELILRNKKSYEMREASMQRHQTNREQMLNRI